MKKGETLGEKSDYQNNYLKVGQHYFRRSWVSKTNMLRYNCTLLLRRMINTYNMKR